MMEPIRTNAMLATCVAPHMFRLTDFQKPNPGIRRIIMRQFVFPPIADPKMDMASSNQIKGDLAKECCNQRLKKFFNLKYHTM
ncbi:hypothetical protein CDAR_453571 [Caerostris darwini]|uniref:Uncharacterized protein n=1 Tax=Caerostris darwini TaxID=1538125 RepID=A0AAV4VUW9_9ARAC|nr:hypothetical protein CDAR_453571 [Caerostris darwini]